MAKWNSWAQCICLSKAQINWTEFELVNKYISRSIMDCTLFLKKAGNSEAFKDIIWFCSLSMSLPYPPASKFQRQIKSELSGNGICRSWFPLIFKETLFWSLIAGPNESGFCKDNEISRTWKSFWFSQAWTWRYRALNTHSITHHHTLDCQEKNFCMW